MAIIQEQFIVSNRAFFAINPKSSKGSKSSKSPSSIKIELRACFELARILKKVLEHLVFSLERAGFELRACSDPSLSYEKKKKSDSLVLTKKSS